MPLQLLKYIERHYEIQAQYSSAKSVLPLYRKLAHTIFMVFIGYALGYDEKIGLY